MQRKIYLSQKVDIASKADFVLNDTIKMDIRKLMVADRRIDGNPGKDILAKWRKSVTVPDMEIQDSISNRYSETTSKKDFVDSLERPIANKSLNFTYSTENNEKNLDGKNIENPDKKTHKKFQKITLLTEKSEKKRKTDFLEIKELKEEYLSSDREFMTSGIQTSNVLPVPKGDKVVSLSSYSWIEDNDDDAM